MLIYYKHTTKGTVQLPLATNMTIYSYVVYCQFYSPIASSQLHMSLSHAVILYSFTHFTLNVQQQLQLHMHIYINTYTYTHMCVHIDKMLHSTLCMHVCITCYVLVGALEQHWHCMYIHRTQLYDASCYFHIGFNVESINHLIYQSRRCLQVCV